MTNKELNRLIGERNALEVIANSYRRAIREARRLLNIDELGLADYALAYAERFKVPVVEDTVTEKLERLIKDGNELVRKSDELKEAEIRVVDKAVERHQKALADLQTTTAALEAFAAKLREGKK